MAGNSALRAGLERQFSVSLAGGRCQVFVPGTAPVRAFGLRCESVEKKFRNPLTLLAGSRILPMQLGRKKSKHISP